MSTQNPAGPVCTDPRPIVFFDGACPLCRREIDHYRRIDGEGRLRWVDVASETDILVGHGLDMERAMAELHVLDGNGRWQRGVDAFLVIWSRLPAYRRLARLISILRLRTPLGYLYRPFAAWRYRNRCGTNSCAVAIDTRDS